MKKMLNAVANKNIDEFKLGITKTFATKNDKVVGIINGNIQFSQTRDRNFPKKILISGNVSGDLIIQKEYKEIYEDFSMDPFFNIILKTDDTERVLNDVFILPRPCNISLLEDKVIITNFRFQNY